MYLCRSIFLDLAMLDKKYINPLNYTNSTIIAGEPRMSFLDEIKEKYVEDDFIGFKKIIDGLDYIDKGDEEWGDQNAFIFISSQIRSDSDKFKFAEYLIDKGAKLNQTCGSMSPLIDAAKNGAISWMKILIARGADVNYCDSTYPPILEAIRADVPESLSFLLNEPTINLEFAKESASGNSLMKFAKEKKAKQCIELLKNLKIK